jgi:16S rRNA (cytosine1402-N4)-methyltransferase
MSAAPQSGRTPAPQSGRTPAAGPKSLDPRAETPAIVGPGENAPPAHRSVLPAEAITWLRPHPGGNYVDATLGAGGHARAILDASAPDGRLLGLDLDSDALQLASEQLRPYGDRVHLLQRSFRELPDALAAAGLPARGGVDGILFDLGVSSMQLDQPQRGFAFTAEGPLDMRLDPGSGEPAAALVNRLPERELADLLYTYGEEPASRRIARAIVRRREVAPFRTTTDLARTVAGASGASREWRRVHPATRTFQALRIAVNDELGALEEALPAAAEALAPGGRLVAIAFHSLEDRIVKHFLRQRPDLQVLTRKPLSPGPAEVAANPRARSAKLRAAEKLDPSAAS